jgi:acyl-CoA synthetase (AMP-forming)/AMP-acid ligase II
MRIDVRPKSLIEAIDHAATVAPIHSGFVFIDRGGRSMAVSYGELHERVARSAGALKDRGVRNDDVVVIAIESSVDAVQWFFGAMALGAIPCLFPNQSVRLDPSAYLYRLGNTVDQLRPTLVVVDSASAPDRARLTTQIETLESLNAEAGAVRIDSGHLVPCHREHTRLYPALCRRGEGLSRDREPALC